MLCLHSLAKASNRTLGLPATRLPPGPPLPLIPTTLSGTPTRILSSCWLAKKRRLATVVYFTMMLATLLVAVLSGVPPGARLPLVVLCMVLQVLAMIWYSLSYIPFGRDLAKKCCKKCVPTADDSV